MAVIVRLGRMELQPLDPDRRRRRLMVLARANRRTAVPRKAERGLLIASIQRQLPRRITP